MGKTKTGFSLRTKDATEGGGIEGALATIAEIGFVEEFTYGGRHKDKPAAALRVVFDIPGVGDKPWEQHYSVGPSDKYEVVDDGDGIRSTGKQVGLNKKSPAYFFFEHVEKAAEEASIDLDELLPEIEGEDVQSVRPLEGRTVKLTNAKYETVGGDTKEGIFIGSFEEDEAPAKSNGKSSKTSSKKSSSDDIEAKTIAAISELIEEHTSVKKGDLANLVLAANKKDPDVKAMMNLCFKDAFVADEDRPWSFDKKKGILRAS